MHHDVASESDWQAVMDFIREEFGRLDVLVNNAAIHHVVAIEEETGEAFDRILAINLKGTFLGMRSAAELMRSSGGGSIVNISSLAGLQGYWGHGAYSASKWGVTGLTKVAAIELGPAGIRVNSVHPGPIETDMLTGSTDPARFQEVPAGRVGQPIDVAELVLFLASDASSFLTGAAIPIDGGLAAGRVPRQAREP
jgi:3alpha(or 20beta)-hydroxysteroid dehydrogenase